MSMKKSDSKKDTKINNNSFLSFVWSRYKKSRLGVAALIMILIFSLIAILSPIIANDRPIIMINDSGISLPAIFAPKIEPDNWNEYISQNNYFAIFPIINHSPIKINIYNRFESPSLNHLMGTDNLGRDVASRMIHGSWVSLRVGFSATIITLILGLLFGMLAGYYGGVVDMIISRFIEIIICFPSFFLILALMSVVKPSVWNIILVLGIFGWTGVARLIRAEFLKIKSMEYIEAARISGITHIKIIFKHILPNAITPVLIYLAFGVSSAILAESGLSFLGFGVQPPTASWGQIMDVAQQNLRNWWLFLFPGFAIFYTVFGYNILGETLRDALDPKSK